MKIRFLQTYCGRETAMLTIDAGEVLELDHAPALDLIGYGVAEEVTELQPLPDMPKPKVKKVKHDTYT